MNIIKYFHRHTIYLLNVFKTVLLFYLKEIDMSYTRCLYHVIFRTKFSQLTLPVGPDKELYNYIAGIARNKRCVPYQINGMPDHVHILASLAPVIAVADFVKEVKNATSVWLKGRRDLFPFFSGWAVGYAGLSYSEEAIHNISEYIRTQKEHHMRLSFHDELRKLLDAEHIDIDENYFLKD